MMRWVGVMVAVVVVASVFAVDVGSEAGSTESVTRYVKVGDDSSH